MKEITLQASIDNVAKVTEFVDAFLEENDFPMKMQLQIDIAIDELFSNIAYYAYGEENGEVTIKIDRVDSPDRIELSFIDNGIPYNPLEKADPNVTLDADEREVGGLGIFIVKKSMDEVKYELKDGQNILTVVKYY